MVKIKKPGENHSSMRGIKKNNAFLEKKIASEIAREISGRKSITADELNAIKKSAAQKHNFQSYLTNIRILSNLSQANAQNLKGLLMTKPIRGEAGVSVIAVMTAPFSCPHGKCVFCPGGVGSVFGNTPQSYTGKEPAAMRAKRASYDPYVQVMNRLEQCVATGHIPEKAELIVMGGTFPSFPEKYRRSFIAFSIKAMNDFSSMFFKKKRIDFRKFNRFFMLPGDITDAKRTKKIQKKLIVLKKKKTALLEKEQKKNERAMVRCVALCIETRPDYCKEEHIKDMLYLGATRVEMGVQSIYDAVLNKSERGHTVADVIDATSLMKDSFLKVGYHIMPGLPGSNPKKDIGVFRELFKNQKFRPDNLKIYPCMVVSGTKLYSWWKNRSYTPLDAASAAEIIAEGKRFVPNYCRIMRVQRDIPTKFTEAGAEMTNLRQLVDSVLAKKGIKCRCIRCREPRSKHIDYKSVIMRRADYEASFGTEVFLSFEDSKNDFLIAFCRLRIPNRRFMPEIEEGSAGIRELHVYGNALGLSESSKEGSAQHKGFGRALVGEAERIARDEFKRKSMYIISGMGAREYYRRLGYKRKGAYMKKNLQSL
jgi:elongator complex protein 3